MEKFLKSIDSYAMRIALVMLVLVYLRGCFVGNDIEKSRKEQEIQFQQLEQKMNKMDSTLKKEIKIEGLRSERRMIDATNRNMLDVARQNEIDAELKKLEK
jgi:cell division protein FtsB